MEGERMCLPRRLALEAEPRTAKFWRASVQRFANFGSMMLAAPGVGCGRSGYSFVRHILWNAPPASIDVDFAGRSAKDRLHDDAARGQGEVLSLSTTMDTGRAPEKRLMNFWRQFPIR